jgi:hypothetical protein
VHPGHRLDSRRGGPQRIAGGKTILAACLHLHQAGDDLQAVLDAMVALAKHDRTPGCSLPGEFKGMAQFHNFSA